MAFFKDRVQHLSENSKSVINFSFWDTQSLLEDKITRMENGTLLWIIWPYWSGKSTAINQIKSKLEDADNIWVEIDTWQFPNRQELWEWMIYKMAKELWKDEWEIWDTIDGRTSQKAGYIARICGLASVWLTDKFFELLAHPPMRRVHELQTFLKNVVDYYPNNIVIVLEDVDRAGEAGLYFLETVSLFFKENFPWKNIKVLVPISNKKYVEHSDTYLKCFDYTFIFSPIYKSVESFLELITAEGANGKISMDFSGSVKIPEIFVKDHLSCFLAEILSKWATPRDIRNILRSSDIAHDYLIWKGLLYPDIRLIIAIEASKILKWDLWFKLWIGGRVTAKNPIEKLIILTANPRSQWNSIKDNYSLNYKFEPTDLAQGSFGSSRIDFDGNVCIPDFYLWY